MLKYLPFIYRYKATLSYIVFIVVLNYLYSYLPMISYYNQMFTPADMLVGAVYIFRDFAQREIKHKVILAMLVGAGLSYLMATKDVATASVCAFLVGETIDWLIFTFTKKPLSQRLIWSSMISAPIDSYVFLLVLNRVMFLEFSLMTLSKFLGVIVVWLAWKRYGTDDTSYSPATVMQS